VGKDRVQRIWRREGLKVPQKQRARDKSGTSMISKSQAETEVSVHFEG